MTTSHTRVLIAEDDFLVSEMIQGILKETGYIVAGTAANGHQAIEMTRSIQPDVILMDIGLPDIDGVQAAQRIYESCPTPIVILTAYDAPELVERASLAGVGAYLVKPPSAREIERAIIITMARFNDIMELRRLNTKLQAEIAQRAEAEAALLQTTHALQKSEEKYRHVVNHANEAIVVAQDGMLRFFNPKLVEIGGYSETELTSRPFAELVHPDDQEMITKYHFERSQGEQVPSVYSFRIIDKSGNVKWVEINAVLIDWEGRPATLTFLNDITERKQAEEQIKTSLREKEVLLREVHHRVKNNLQIIHSLLDLQSNYIQDKRALEVFRESQQRVRAMALVHERLYQSKDLSQVDLAEYIQNLSNDLLLSYGTDASSITLTTNISDITLDIDTAIPCSLIISELVSNALKHAFSDGRKGEIGIDFHPVDDDRLTLTVRDNGVSLPKDWNLENVESFGLRLVGMLVRQLQGEMEIDRSDGTAFKITLKTY